jgi:hypothetical protein
VSDKKLPIGLQDFKKIREGNYLYIDKTRQIENVLERQGSFFLSRPRRFGKSLLVSTLHYLFQGKKELFKGLFIEDKWDFQEYPVIKISFSNIGYENGNLNMAIHDELIQIAKTYQIELTSGEKVKNLFRTLILALNEKFQRKVVILIDEYDKPLIDYLDKENLHRAIENRGILKSFYSVLKDADPNLQLVFITGVSKFSQVSIFSDLNNLYDISMTADYNEICGITQAELDANFEEELQLYGREEVRRWYNGYRFYPNATTLYNPFSILNFFAMGGDFRNFWYTTGTPTFLMKMCKENKVFEMKDISLSQTGLNSFDIENLNLAPILFQTGYLTIKDFNPIFKIYHLDYPNNEVRSSFIEGLLEIYSGSKEPITATLLDQFYQAMVQKSPDYLESAFNLLFAHIPYDLWFAENEKFYHIITHLLFTLLGVHIQSEVHTKNGRADVVIHFQNNIYCLEFKLDRTAEEAIEQIKNRGYLEQYASTQQPLHLIGINFSSANKKVEKVIWETVEY